MRKQIKYAARQTLSLRLAALGIFILTNVAFGILGTLNIYGNGIKITAVTLSSIAMTGLFVTAVIADARLVKNVLSAPAGYHVLLVPVRAWKILLSRILVIVAFDLVSFAAGILGVLWQSLILANVSEKISRQDIWRESWWLLLAVAGYMLLITAVFFGGALSKTVFFRWRLRQVFSAISFVAVVYLLSLMDFALAAVAPLNRWGGIFYTVTIYSGFNSGMIAYVFLILLKIAILFFGTAYLLERRINL